MEATPPGPSEQGKKRSGEITDEQYTPVDSSNLTADEFIVSLFDGQRKNGTDMKKENDRGQ